MNKKIKVIDLIDKKYHNLELPKHIRINKLEYFYNENRKTYDSEYGEQMSFDFTDNVLNMEVEILEDNTKEIEELEKFDIQGLEVSGYSIYSMTQAEYLLEDGIEENRQKINELVKVVKEIRKDLNK